MKISGQWISLFSLLIGFGCLALGLVNYFQMRAFFATAEPATATITGYVIDANGHDAMFCPRYEFSTKSGRTFSFLGDGCTSRPIPGQVGKTSDIYYDPKDPQSTHARGLLGSETDGLIFGILEFLFFLAIAALIWLHGYLSKHATNA